ncbi:MAG: OB-fold nucleic acid binding domain-containing protein, partial [Thermoanaerobaculia bacterium]
SGIVFMTIEDETGTANLILRPWVYQRFRSAARSGVVILARGRIERQDGVVHVLVDSIETADRAVAELAARSRDFH